MHFLHTFNQIVRNSYQFLWLLLNFGPKHTVFTLREDTSQTLRCHSVGRFNLLLQHQSNCNKIYTRNNTNNQDTKGLHKLILPSISNQKQFNFKKISIFLKKKNFNLIFRDSIQKPKFNFNTSIWFKNKSFTHILMNPNIAILTELSDSTKPNTLKI